MLSGGWRAILDRSGEMWNRVQRDIKGRKVGRMKASRITNVLAVLSAIVAGVTASERSFAQGYETRGTWITAGDHDLVATPLKIGETMSRLSEMGVSTVYVDVWSNGQAGFVSKAVERAAGGVQAPTRLLEDTLIEASRHGLIYFAWFSSGFALGPKDGVSAVRKIHPDWLSRDAKGSDVAPDGSVWLNPAHPEARRFLLDLVLEAVDGYDLDGVQFGDSIGWPAVTMGYDQFTKKAYADDHGGVEPPSDAKDAGWVKWRTDKVNEFAKMLVQEIRAKRPGLLISLSPSLYPASIDEHMLEWPKWGAWKPADSVRLADKTWAGNAQDARWDEFVPRCFTPDFDSFRSAWLEQLRFINEMGGARIRDVAAGMRLSDDGKRPPWEDVQRSIETVRRINARGHVLLSCREVLGGSSAKLTEFYSPSTTGPAIHPVLGPKWRTESTDVFRTIVSNEQGDEVWSGGAAGGTWRPIAFDGERWIYIDRTMFTAGGRFEFSIPQSKYLQMQVVRDRRPELSRQRPGNQ